MLAKIKRDKNWSLLSLLPSPQKTTNGGKTQYLKGFTMAEVLVTLVILGLAAALTIPNLIKDYQKQTTVTGLEKAFGTFSNAVKMSEIDNGSSESWYLAATWNTAASATFWNTYLIPYLRVQKECTTSHSDLISTDCWAPSTGLDGAITSMPNGNITLILNDGMTVYLAGISGTYGIIYVDVNGFKKPNVIGKDIFRIDFMYKIGRIQFYGQGLSRTSLLGNSSNSCNSQTGSGKGDSCGALIQLDGWKIGDGYPWD